MLIEQLKSSIYYGFSIKANVLRRPSHVAFVSVVGLAERVHEQRPRAAGRGGIKLCNRPNGAQNERSKKTTEKGGSFF